MKNLVAVSLTLFMVLFVGTRGVAAESGSYKIHDAAVLPAPSVTGVGRVVEWGVIPLQFNGERMIIGRDPDGSGNSRLGDQFQLIISQPDGGTSLFQYDNYNSSCSFVNPPVSPKDVSNYFSAGPGFYNVTWRYIDYCGGDKTIDSLYLNATPRIPVNTPTPSPTIAPSPTNVPTSTPTPTVTPSPTPTQAPVRPTPFLRLPWNYEKYGMSFGEAALRMSSYFDHEYPLLSAILAEPADAKNSVITFKNNLQSQESYTSHDGYDYAFGARALMGDPVLAAAGGRATFMNTCPACGNAILIDHGNYFQTRYYHLDKKGLIVSDPRKSVTVIEGQQIGLVGATGNVTPAGDRGAHIHFMVVEDKNRDGSFDDNIPDGVTDPFGWNSIEPDPWTNYTFNYKDALRKGNASSYLWKRPLDEAAQKVPTQGAAVSIPHVTFTFDPDSYSDAFIFTTKRSTPVTYGESLSSIGNTIIAQAVAGVDTFVTRFYKLFTLKVDFSKEDLSNFKLDSLALYSSADGKFWSKEPTVVDLTKKTAVTRVDHLTHFALMGVRKDTTPPVVTAFLNGKKGRNNMYRSDISIEFRAGETPNYIMYRLDSNDWTRYTHRIHVRSEGDHTIEFYGADRAGNIGETQTTRFTVDTKIPEATLSIDLELCLMKVVSHDPHDGISIIQVPHGTKAAHVMIQDEADNTLEIEMKERVSSKSSRETILVLRYNDDEFISIPLKKSGRYLKVTTDHGTVNYGS